MGRVIHFEYFTEDPQEALAFFGKVFDWKVEAWEGPFEYHLVSTGQPDMSGIDGAVAPPGATKQTIVLSAAVDDLDAAIEAVIAAGGKLESEKGPVAGVGWHAYVSDPSGTVFGMMEEDPTAGMSEEELAEQERLEEASTDAWNDVGERLRELGVSVGKAFGETASSPQAQRVRQEAEKAASSIKEVSAAAAEKARPYVVSALDRMSQELDQLTTRLRQDREASETEPPEPESPARPKDPDDSASEESGGDAS